MMRRNRRLAGALAAVGLAISAAMLGTGTARADSVPPLPPQTWSEIFNPYLHAQGNTLCFDDPSGSTAVGQLQQLWRCHGYAANGAPQRWEFSPVTVNGFNQVDPFTGNLIYHVYNDAAGKCLSYTTVRNGSQLALYSCSAQDPLQKWELVGDSAVSQNGLDFQLGLVEPDSAPLFCAAADTFTDNNGTPLMLEWCSPYDTSQIWNLG